MKKNKKIIRKIDETGRIVLPKPFREALDLFEGDNVEIVLEDGYITLKKTQDICSFCGGTDITLFKGKPLCKACISEIKKS